MSKKILLVSGHVSGYNKCAETGVNEGDLNIELVGMVESKLSPYADVTVYPSNRDWYKDNLAGKSVVNPKEYDYILEVHFNAGKGSGTSIYLHSDYKGGVSVEEAILRNLHALGIRLRGTNGFNRKNTLLNMNICQKYGVDYALIETLFYDNQDDMSFYAVHKNEVATAIANGIITGFGISVTEIEADAIENEAADNPAYVYRVQVGSFSDKDNAEKLLTNLRALNYDGYVVRALKQ